MADVASKTDMRRVAATALRAFGGFDSWVNNAGVSIYGSSRTPSDREKEVTLRD